MRATFVLKEGLRRAEGKQFFPDVMMVAEESTAWRRYPSMEGRLP
jgi:hypothetical protein